LCAVLHCVRNLALAFLLLGAMLCACGAGASGQHGGGDGERLSFEGLSLLVPPGWSHYEVDFGPSLPEPMLWVANVTLPTKPSSEAPNELPPYQVLSRLSANGIVLLVDAVHAESAAEEECPRSQLRLTAADVNESGYEGQPAPTVATGSVYTHRHGLCLFAQAWFGVNEPGQEMRDQVNRVLGSVEFAPVPPS
jgi:hypothetical protein